MQPRLFLISLTVLLTLSCFGPVRHYLEQPPENNSDIDTAKQVDTAADSPAAKPGASPKVAALDTVPLSPAPDFLEVEAWPDKWFVVLEKPVLYCNYGYDLYTCPQVDSCRGPVDTSLISKYHRARCLKFAGNRLKALSVTPRGTEWVVSFKDEKSGTTLYARTVKDVLGEIVLESDLDGAKNRFAGKTVYSARGFITSFEKGKASGIKVKLQDPLKVYGVRFGLTPLPTKPIWLMVETERGEKGSIPIYFSWTNVKKELRRPGFPWEEDVFEINPARTFKVDAAIWDIINAHTVREGMTRDEVRLSWGFPLSEKKETLDGKERECWKYQAQRLYFDEKELMTIKEK
jgi:hypothetical protein